MSLKGIDISGWQKGIDLSIVEADFVIMKATQGTRLISNDFRRQYQQAKDNGKLLGIYHYAEGGNYISEADYFLNTIGNRVGEAILCLDWERANNPTYEVNDFNWVKGFCDYVFKKTSVRPIIYIQRDAIKNINGIGNYALWVAQYKYPESTPTGYQKVPWNEGQYKCLIRQYTSYGKLSGYSGRLDLNKFYGDKQTWNRYAAIKTDEIKSEQKDIAKSTTLDLVIRVLRGEFGTGTDRKNALGSRYSEVQGFINHISNASVEELANDVLIGKYGVGKLRKEVLGSRYSEVQKLVNSYSTPTQYYTIKAGDTLSKIAIQFGTTVSKLVNLNKITNPDLIYAGTKIRVK